jgi:hypothetical protein
MLWFHITGNVQEMRLKPGDRVEPDSDHLFIVRSGTGQILRNGPGGHDILLRVVREGAVVEERGTLLAETTLDVVAVPRGRA